MKLSLHLLIRLLPLVGFTFSFGFAETAISQEDGSQKDGDKKVVAEKSDPPAGDDAEVTFENHVLPIFERRCVECHGISKKSAGLRLDSFEAVLEGSRKNDVVESGKGADSLIYTRLLLEGKKRMPPEGAPLTAAQIALPTIC